MMPVTHADSDDVEIQMESELVQASSTRHHRRAAKPKIISKPEHDLFWRVKSWLKTEPPQGHDTKVSQLCCAVTSRHNSSVTTHTPPYNVAHRTHRPPRSTTVVTLTPCRCSLPNLQRALQCARVNRAQAKCRATQGRLNLRTASKRLRLVRRNLCSSRPHASMSTL